MLLNLSLLSVLLLNIFYSNLKVLFILTIILLLLNLKLNKNLKHNIKILRVIVFFYVSIFIIQIFYNQEGKILFQIYNVYITDKGLLNFLINFIRVLNLMLLSWIVSATNIFKNRLGKYQKSVEIIIDFVPEVFTFFKQKQKLKYFYRYMLRKIKEKYEEEGNVV